MSELEILFPEVPNLAISSSASNEDSNYPHQNLFSGGSTTYFKRADNGTQTTIDFDLGLGNTQTIDFAYFRGANLLIAEADAEVDLSIHASTDNFSASDVTILSVSNITSANLTGTHNEDILLTAATSSAYRYWRIQIDSTTSFKHLLRACYFGTRRTLGRSPSFPYSPATIFEGKRFTADSGAMFQTSNGRPKRAYSFNWRAITDAIRDAFDHEVVRYSKDFPIVLYAPSAGIQSPLNGKEVVFGWFTAAWQAAGPKKDFNNLQISFIEDTP